jgi:phosphate uptake regulator
METRKVQLSGGTTFTVSLPKSWATEQNVSSGSVLYLHPEDDGTLLVEARSQQTEKTHGKRLDVSGYDEEMFAETVKSMYLVGVDRLVLVDKNGHGEGRLRSATELTAGLSGLELLETTDTKVVFENLIDPSSISVRKSVLRLKLVALAMYRDAVRAVTDADADLAAQVAARDTEADKLFCLVSRQFRRALDDLQTVEKLGTTRSELYEYYHTARQLERVGDHATKTATLVSERGDDLVDVDTEEFARLADESRRIVDRAADVVLTDVDATTGFAVLSDATALDADAAELDRELYDREDADGAYVVGLLLDSVRRTARYGRNVAEVGIQGALRAQDDSRYER